MSATPTGVPATPAVVQHFDSTAGREPRLPDDSFNVPFDEAIAWARERRAVLPAEFYGARLQAVRARSFAISGLAALDQVQQVADSLAEATAAGATLREWQKTLPESVFSLGKARRELIFRNAVQTHYGIGRTIQQRENAAARPYLMWDAINDSRTRPTHRAMDGHIAPVDDPIWQRWTPPAGHNCFLPGTRVRGDFRIGLQTLYAGPAVELLTSSGARLAVTGNHPVLTSNGWVAAQRLKVGDDLLCHGRVVDPATRAVEYDEDSPPTVEEVFDALSSQALGTADIAAFHLHGDAQFGKGEVHVVGADGVLVNGFKPARSQRQEQRHLVPADDATANGVLHSSGPALALTVGAAVLRKQPFDIASRRARGVCDDACSKFGASVKRHGSLLKRIVARIRSAPRGCALALYGAPVALDGGPLHEFRLAAPANICPMPEQQRSHRVAGDAGLRGNGLLTRAFTVLLQQVRHVPRRPLWTGLRASSADGVAALHRAALNPGIAQQTVEQAVAHGGLFQALSHGFPGDVGAYQVVSVRHFTFRGHVYDFETKQGWLSADGVIVSNCRCTRISLTEAQARARGYPNADPGVEPDAGWGGDPTEGNDDLVSVIRARRAQCAYSFAAKKRSRGLWCDDGEARDRMLWMATALDHDAPMPPPRALNLPLLPAGTGEGEAFRAFMLAMGDERAREIEVSPIPGVTLNVSQQMFTDHKTGESKLDKRGRAAYVLYLAETILRPDEAWMQTGRLGDATLVLLSRFARGRAGAFSSAAFFKQVGSAWEGWSAFQIERSAYLEAKRSGVLIYRREP